LGENERGIEDKENGGEKRIEEMSQEEMRLFLESGKENYKRGEVGPGGNLRLDKIPSGGLID